MGHAVAGGYAELLGGAATTSSTASTGPPDGTSVSESGTVFSAIRRMRPSRG